MSGRNGKEEMKREDVRKLVGAAYSVSFPYLLLLLGGILIAFWLIILIFS